MTWYLMKIYKNIKFKKEWGKVKKRTIALSLVGMLAIGAVGCSSEKSTDDVIIGNSQAQKTGYEHIKIDKTLLKNENVTVVLKSIFREENEYQNSVGFEVFIKNNSDVPISVWANTASIGDKMVCLAVDGTEIRPGCEVNETWTFFDNDDNTLDIELNEMKNIKFELQVDNNETLEAISTTDIFIGR